MGILRWCFAATAALLVGAGFGLFSGSIVLGAYVAVVLLVAAYLSWETRLLGLGTRVARSTRASAGRREYGVYGGAADGGSASGEGCGFGGDGGGSFGADGGGAGGC